MLAGTRAQLFTGEGGLHGSRETRFDSVALDDKKEPLARSPVCTVGTFSFYFAQIISLDNADCA